MTDWADETAEVVRRFVMTKAYHGTGWNIAVVCKELDSAIAQALRDARAEGIESAAKLFDNGDGLAGAHISKAIRALKHDGDLCPACGTRCGWTHSNEQGLDCPHMRDAHDHPQTYSTQCRACTRKDTK